MEIRYGTLDAIGNTPLIKLRRASEETGCTILGKAEFMNPGLSVKDRAALGIVTDAIDKGQLRPGGLIVEGTAGNTGIGLDRRRQCARHADGDRHPGDAVAGEERHAALARRDLVEVPAAPYRNPNNYVKVAGAHGRAAGARAPARRDLRQPVRQCRQPRHPCAHHRPGDLGPDRRHGRRLRQRGRHRRDSGRGCGWRFASGARTS